MEELGFPIIIGVTIAVLGQISIEFFIKPRVKLRDLYTDFSQKILLYQSKYQNALLEKDDINEIKNITTKFIGLAWAYRFNKRKKRTLLEIGRDINRIAYESDRNRNNSEYTPNYESLFKSINKIEMSLTSIKTTYEIKKTESKNNKSKSIVKVLVIIFVSLFFVNLAATFYLLNKTFELEGIVRNIYWYFV